MYKNEEKLIQALLPKIAEYFTEHEYLKKEDLSDFLDFIDLNIWDSESEKEILWNALMKGLESEKNLQRVMVVKNLTHFIHSHDKELFQPEKTLEKNVRNYMNFQPYYSNNISFDSQQDESLYELYKLLSLLQYSNSKIITLYDLNQHLHNNTFIKLDKETLSSLLNEFSKDKVTELLPNLYFNLMDEFSKRFILKRNEINEKVYIYNENDLEEAEHPDYNYISNYIDILNKHRDSLIIILQTIETINKTNDKSKEEIDYYNKYLISLLNAIQVYLNEIEAVYWQQKQKFDYFNDKVKQDVKYLLEEKELLEDRIQNNLNSSRMYHHDNLHVLNEEIVSLKEQNVQLTQEIDKLRKDLLHKGEELITSNNNLIFSQNKVNELEGKVNTVTKEKDILNKNYTELLQKLNNKILNENNNNKHTQNANINSQQEIQSKTEQMSQQLHLEPEQKNLINKYHSELISYIIEKDKYCCTLEQEMTTMKNHYNILENTKQSLENKITELTIQNSSLKQQFNEQEILIDNYKKDIEVYKNNKGKLLSSLLGNEFDESEKEDSSKHIYKEVKAISLYIEGKAQKHNLSNSTTTPSSPNDGCKYDFDFLSIKMNEEIIKELDDDYYNTTSSLIFSEKIKYIDENKKSFECILLITQSYMYIFNINTLDKCDSHSLTNLTTINASTKNNYITLHFDDGDIMIIEIFRVLEFINFFKILNVQEKSNNYSINVNEFYNNFEGLQNKKNYTICPFYGRTKLTGYLLQKAGTFLTTTYEGRFVVLCDIGLIIMDEPNGKPLDIINPLFCESRSYIDERDYKHCFELFIGKKKYVFKTESEHIRRKWINALECWILETYSMFNSLMKPVKIDNHI